MTMDSQSASSERILYAALKEIAQTSPLQTDGKWLEYLTRDCAPQIADWDVSDAWLWQEWPDRGKHYPRKTDLGADVVARRASDGALIAIQCKSRQLNEHGHGAPINAGEIDRFIAFSADSLWAERWVVVNGAVKISDNAIDTAGSTKPLKRIDIESDLRKQKDLARPARPEPCPHCDGSGGHRTRDCMQEEAIGTSVTLLREHAKANGSGRARGRIILPCGTGKSRIALRIVERLTEPGQVSAVLCPSIALVSQLRAEFLAHCAVSINALAVCSDEGVARDKDLASDPTADLGHASASEVKGLVTTRADEIGRWIDGVAAEGDRIGVIFGTYQSSHRIADALGNGEVQVLVADEAHRTAGLRRIAKLTERLRDFTVCHDDARFPAKYRIYQTATPRIYTGGAAEERRLGCAGHGGRVGVRSGAVPPVLRRRRRQRLADRLPDHRHRSERRGCLPDRERARGETRLQAVDRTLSQRARAGPGNGRGLAWKRREYSVLNQLHEPDRQIQGDDRGRSGPNRCGTGCGEGWKPKGRKRRQRAIGWSISTPEAGSPSANMRRRGSWARRTRPHTASSMSASSAREWTPRLFPPSGSLRPASRPST